MCKARNTLFVLLAVIVLLFSAIGCAQKTSGEGGPMIKIITGGNTKLVPAEGFDESYYLKRGYMRNTDAQGRPLYILIVDDNPASIIGGDDDSASGRDGEGWRGEGSRGGRGGRGGGGGGHGGGRR